MAEFIVALPAITITTGENDVIKLDENGSVASATIAPGTYFARGDGTASDLLAAIATALGAAFGGGNAYTVTAVTAGAVASWCITPSAASATFKVTRSSGSTTFRVRWNHGSANFPAALLGFTTEKGSADANPEYSTLSPSSCWVHNDRFIDLLPDMSAPRPEVEMASGGLEGVDRGDPSHTRRLLLELVDGRRMWAYRITADPDRSYSRFWQLARDGRQVEIHTVDLQTGSSTLLDALTTSTRHISDTVTSWILAGESAERIGATRVRTGMDHWDLEASFSGYVAP